MNMPIGMIALMIIAILVYCGIAQRLLDRMRLTDRNAILFILAMIAGSFIDIPLLRGDVNLNLNVGGAVLPFGLCVYLLVKAGAAKERLRAIMAAALVAAAVFWGSRYLPNEPETMVVDPKLLYGITAGLIAYLAGRSRRSAFIGGVMGIILSDVIHLTVLLRSGVVGSTSIGGAGVFDVVIITGLIAVMTAELVGETREKMQGGPVLNERRPAGLYEFSNELGADQDLDGRDNNVISINSKKKSTTGGDMDGESDD